MQGHIQAHETHAGHGSGIQAINSTASKLFLLLLDSQRLLNCGVKERTAWVGMMNMGCSYQDFRPWHWVGAQCLSRNDSNCMCSPASNLGEKDPGQYFLPIWAIRWLIVHREQLFFEKSFEKQANICICCSAISPDSDRYRPPQTPMIRNTEGDHLRKLESPERYKGCFAWVGGHMFLFWNEP